MDFDIKLFREAGSQAGEHSRWTAVGLKDFVEIEAAAAFELRKNGYFTSRVGRRLLRFLALTAGLSDGLSAKRMREIWTFGVPYPNLCDQKIENRLRLTLHSQRNLNIIKTEICHCIGKEYSSRESMLLLFIELLAHFDLTRWPRKSNLIEKISDKMLESKLSMEALSAMLEIASNFAPEKSDASDVGSIDWPYNGNDVGSSLRNATDENLRKKIASALRYIKPSIEGEMIALGRISSQVEISDVLSYLFWPGCSLKEAGEALLRMLKSLEPEKVSKFIQLDEEYIQESRVRAGFPDLVAWDEEDFLFLEVKGPKDRLQESQKKYESHVLKKLGYGLSICNVSPALGGRNLISSFNAHTEVGSKKAVEIDRSIRETNFPKVRGCVKPNPRILKAHMYYRAATEESQQDNLGLAVEILECARNFCREESIYFNIDKYVQYKFASGWRGDFESILKEDFFKICTLPGLKKLALSFPG